MICRTITIKMKNKPRTCFDCDFSLKQYIWATCPFLNTSLECGKTIPKECPLTIRNKDKSYLFNEKIYDRVGV